MLIDNIFFFQADLWSLGLIIFELLVGEHFFTQTQRVRNQHEMPSAIRRFLRTPAPRIQLEIASQDLNNLLNA
jgi:serine/threonine protein kinase